MKVPGLTLVHKAQDEAQSAEGEVNKVQVPLTRKLGLVDFVKQLVKEMGEDHLGAFAGNLAYSGLFSLFPFAIFILSLLGIFHATSLVNTLIDRMSSSMPKAMVTLLRNDILSVAGSHSKGTYSIGAIIALLLALWGVSGGFRAVMEATNVVYEVQDTRPFWKKYAISILLALVTSVLLISALVLVVFGPAIGGAVANYFGLGTVFQWTWNIVQWPVLVAVVMLAFGVIYYLAPDVKQRFRFISPGSIAAVALWVVFSLLFSLYANNFGSYNKTYGTLAGLAILLLYMYYSAFILLLGAEMNQIIEEHAPGGKQEGQKTNGGTDGEGSRNAESSPTLQILKENRPAPSR